MHTEPSPVPAAHDAERTSTSATTGSALTRREFAASAIAAALTAACARVPATPAPASPAPATPAPASGAATQPDANAPLADALLTVVVARYGKHLPDDERPRVREGILRNLRLGARLASTPVPNSADPYSVCVNAMEEAR
jgi:hypothetical protein